MCVYVSFTNLHDHRNVHMYASMHMYERMYMCMYAWMPEVSLCIFLYFSPLFFENEKAYELGCAGWPTTCKDYPDFYPSPQHWGLMQA